MPDSEKFRADIPEHARINYARFIDNHMIPWFGELTVDDEVFLEPEEFAVLRRHVPADAVDMVDVLVSTGLWRGKVTAFQRRDLTLLSKRPTLRIQRAWKRSGARAHS
ncbi:hypothetical protein NKH77_17105 [Streptomyces sp. M19]